MKTEFYVKLQHSAIVFTLQDFVRFWEKVHMIREWKSHFCGENTVWEFKDISDAQFVREIDLDHFRVS